MTMHRHRRRGTVRYCPLEPPWRYPDALAAAVRTLVTGYTEPGHRVLLADPRPAGDADPWGSRRDEIVEAVLRLGRGATTTWDADGEHARYELIIGPRPNTTQLEGWARRLAPAGTLIILTITRGSGLQRIGNQNLASDSSLRRIAALAGLTLVERLVLLHQPPSSTPPRGRRQRLAVTLGGHRPVHSEVHAFRHTSAKRGNAAAAIRRQPRGKEGDQHRV